MSGELTMGDMGGTAAPKKSTRAWRQVGNILFAAAAASFVATVGIGITSAYSWLKYGDFRLPGWTIGDTFGLNPDDFSGYIGIQNIVAVVASRSLGWVFLCALIVLTWVGELLDKRIAGRAAGARTR